MKHRRLVRVLLYAALIVVAFFMLFPILWAVSASFRTDDELYAYMAPTTFHTFVPVQFTTDAYVRLFRDYGFMQPIVNSLMVCLMTVILGCLVNSIAAVAFAMFDFKGKNLIFSIIVVTFMIPFESIALPLYKVALGLKMINTLEGIYIPSVANGLVLFLFVQFFKDIPRDILEAGVIDGAKWRHLFFRIILPISGSVFVTAALVLFISQWNAYLWPLLVAQSKEIRLIQTRLGDFKTEEATEWAAMYAASMLSAAIPLALFLPCQKYYIEGITSGSLK
ncbi:MAG: carbohydrate ABC transporter permease [Clostridiales bacterium]|nr:carbohydrate ABC transporter permease [Clostridiales bacterium]